MKINKHRRLTKIMQTLERWAPLETSEVTQHLAEIFNVQESDLKRNVLNDLKFLRDEGELTPLYYDKFGKLVSQEVEPEDIQYYRIKWDIADQQHVQVSGANVIKSFQAHIHVSEQVSDNVRIRKGIGKNLSENHYFYFELNHEIFHLSLPKVAKSQKKDTYLILALTRTNSSSPDSLKKDFINLQQKYQNTPLCLMSFNNPFLSSIDEEAPITYRFQTNGMMTLHCEKNKNIVSSLLLEQNEVESLINDLTFFSDKTQTQHWTQLKKQEEKQYLKGNQENVTCPILIKIKETSGFILA